ncbi:glycosyltransferase, partial [Athalassotoga sp.]
FNPLEPYNGSLIERSKIPLFLYVGRIDDGQKNLSFMFKGLSMIKKDWKLIIVGTGPDEDKLKSLANDLGISQKIEWRGFKKDPYENLNEGVTALLLTSRFEGFGMVLAEANQRGIPVISSDCQVGPADIVIPGVNGYLYPEGDMDAFVKIVNDVIDGKVGFGTPEEIARTAERFSGEVVCNNIIKALEDITGLK